MNADCSVGNGNVDVESTPSSSSGLYIDPDNLAPCMGQLTAWNYCYYEPPSGRRIDFTFQLHVWRQDSSANVYRKVGQSDVSFRIRRPKGNFQCDTLSLPESDYIDIERGDVLGVFLGTPTLSLVATTAETSSQGILFTSVGVQDVAAGSDLEMADGRRIHLSADISESLIQYYS